MSTYILRVDLANVSAPTEFTGATVADTPFATYPDDMRCDRCGIALCDHAWQAVSRGKIVDCEVLA
jgi:hypothetical protein